MRNLLGALLLILLQACSGDRIVNKLGQGFLIIDSESCLCKSLVIEHGDNYVTLLDNVFHVAGNDKAFLVGQQVDSFRNYFIVRAKAPCYKEDLLPLDQPTIQTYTDTMQMDFQYKY